MYRSICGVLAVGALAVALAVDAASAAKSSPLITWIDGTDRYTITLPRTWELIPRSEALIRSRIAQLKAKKTDENSALAATFSAILASPQGVSELSSFRLQAFLWPPAPGTSILTEVSVKVTRNTLADSAANLALLGRQYATALRRNSGSKIDSPREVKLPAGNAEFVEGSVPAGGGLANGIELFLLPHGSRLYLLSFTVDARLLSVATIFGAIADHFTVT